MSTLRAEIPVNQIVVSNPATLEQVGAVPVFSVREVTAAVGKAQSIQPEWAATPLNERLKLVKRFQQLLVEQKSEVAAVITREAGKPKSEALSTEILVVLDACEFLLRAAPAALRPERISHGNPAMKLKKGLLLREPWGVVGIISPWNYPFSIPAVETLGALTAGNAVVLKPSEFTPFSALEIQRLLRAAGFPADLLQVITGEGATGAALLQADIHKLIFTGSVATGKRVAQAAAARLLPVVLELGGKDPMIVLDDAGLDVASSAAVWGAFMNAGQTCLSVERCYVHQSLHQKFLDACVAKTAKLRMGNGSHETTDVGPMIHSRQLAIVREQVDDAIAHGARLLAGGKTLPELGPNFYAPTILSDVTASMRIMREETFGPVLPVAAFQTDEEAIALANASEFGLAASVWTSNRNRGERLARRIQAGTVMVNDVISCFGISEAPHGGVKGSGIGRTHGKAGLEEMTWPKYVDSDALPGMKKLWWYPYGSAFSGKMEGFVETLFSKKLINRIKGGLKSAKSYLRSKPV